MRLSGFLLTFVLPVINVAGGTGVEAVRVSGTDEDAFRLSWDAVEGAAGYVVNVWTNGAIGASEGTEVLCERFPELSNRPYASMWSINDVNRSGEYRRWTGELIRGYPSAFVGDEEHAVVLGTADGSGWLRSEPLDLSDETIVRLRLTRHTDDDTAPVQVAFLKNGETSFEESIVLGTSVHSFSDYVVTVSNLESGCQFQIATQKKSSGTKFGRVAVAGIAIVSGRSSGTKVDLPVVTDRRVEETSYRQERTSPVPYFFSVAAFGESVDEHLVAGEVDMGDPPWLRCWRASGFLPKPGVRALDLSGMAPIAAFRDWVNGSDGDGLYAYAQNNGVAKLRPFSSSATNYAVYQLKEKDGQDPVHGLGLLGNGTSGLRLVLPVRLDTKLPLERISVSYVLSRLTWKDGTKDTTMTFSWMTSDDFDAMQAKGSDWNEEELGGFTAKFDGETRVARNVEITDRSLRKAKYLFLKWEVPNQPSSAMVGLADLTVTGLLRKTGLLLSIK